MLKRECAPALWKTKDKAAGLYLLVELASRFEPEEVFQCLVLMTERFSGRLDLKAASALEPKCPALAEGIRQSLEQHT
ncbi:MAG: hypothetical protein JXA11_14360 [Phycisphaerae bacterium]|nr:hypothetical protein [Phycisphaerae bacterium]